MTKQITAKHWIIISLKKIKKIPADNETQCKKNVICIIIVDQQKKHEEPQQKQQNHRCTSFIWNDLLLASISIMNSNSIQKT